MNLSWKTEIYRSEELRGGAFSICRNVLLQKGETLSLDPVLPMGPFQVSFKWIVSKTQISNRGRLVLGKTKKSKLNDIQLPKNFAITITK